MHGVKQKAIVEMKYRPVQKLEKYEKLRLENVEEIKRLRAEGWKVVFIDETTYTKSQWKKTEWSAKKCNYEFNMKFLSKPC